MNSIHHKLNLYDYHHIKNSSLSEFKQLIHQICNSFNESYIKVLKNSKTMLKTSNSMPFHSDPKAKIIAWYCVSQSSLGGESLLIKWKEIMRKLDPIVLKKLSNLKIYDPYDKISVPIIKENKGDSLFYYSPWRIDDENRFTYKAELEKLESCIREINPIKIRLNKGDILIINNKKMLHTRTAISGDKKREIIRHLIC